MAASCIPSTPQQLTLRGGSIHWITVLGAFTHIWRPEIADGCDISYLLIWQKIFSSFHKGKPGEHLCHWFTVLDFMGMGLV